MKLSSPLKPNLRRPERLYRRATSPMLVRPGVGGATFPIRTTVSLLVALSTRANAASAGSSSMSPRRPRSSTRPEKLRGIRSEILPTTKVSQYHAFTQYPDDKKEVRHGTGTAPIWIFKYSGGEWGLALTRPGICVEMNSPRGRLGDLDYWCQVHATSVMRRTGAQALEQCYRYALWNEWSPSRVRPIPHPLGE